MNDFVYTRHSYLLVSGMTTNTGHTWERIYETERDLIATVHNRYGNRTISRFDYTNDAIGRRIARVDSGEAFSETAFERYAYNDRSEVIGSQRFYGSDITDLSHPVTGRTFGYGYDPIGNHVYSYEDAGGARLTTTYTANELNQYTAIQNASAVPLRGDAKREAFVTVNGDRAERDNGTASFTPWSYALPSSNSNASFQHADILAVAQSATGEDGEQRESGSVFVPAEETLLTYDDDGNMTFDGRFRYSWNGENRMIRVEEAVAPTNRAPTVITYAYDEQGRMVSKNIAGTNTVTRSLLWDGYNIVREVENGTPTYNVWSLDLDGTLQGCGGVGGLLAVSKPNGLHITLYDANGNISEYVSSSGSISAHYEYSPFGIQLLSQGESFTHQFSTKPYCPSTGLSEYQLRKYHSILGRWTSRDPMHERAARNLYSMTHNSCIANFDLLGLLKIYIGGAMERTLGQLESFQNYVGATIYFDCKQHGDIEQYIREYVKTHPCESIVLIGHSYGGDTAMDVAASLEGTPCLCLYTVTLDPVGHFDKNTWFWLNPRTDNIKEWINVYQKTGIEDVFFDIPFIGWGIGGIWSLLGSIVNNSDMIASGGGQWNYESNADYNIPAKNGDFSINHHDVRSLINVKVKTKDGREMTVLEYTEEIEQRNCCMENDKK